MELIIIYGPPASGKLTVAKELSIKKSYKLFHNHLTVDLLKIFLKFGTPEFFELNQKIKLDILETAAIQGVDGIVYKFVYDKTTDDPFVLKLKNMAERQNISIRLVQLYCEKKELFKRVTADSRKQYKKVQSKEGLSKYLDSGEFFSSINRELPNVKIDNTKLTVKETVDLVMKLCFL